MRGATGKQRFIELNRGGHNQGRIPIFTSQPRIRSLLVGVEIAVMLDDKAINGNPFNTTHHFAKFARILFDDGCERHDIDDPFQPMHPACRNAKANEASVLPPPVGAVSEKKPEGR